MDNKPKYRRPIHIGALISGAIGLLVAILMSELWPSYIDMIIAYTTGMGLFYLIISGAAVSFWLVSRRSRRKRK